MASIFISYRREDAGGHAGRLCDRLEQRFGAGHVFMDVADLQPGQNFVEAIERTIARCDWVIAVIGPRWLDAIHERARSGTDFVRLEIAAALRRGAAVVPVLVGGARMPEHQQLPEDVAALAHRHAIEVRDERFDADVAHLADALTGQEQPSPGTVPRAATGRPAARAAVAAMVVVALSVAGFLMFRQSAPRIEGVWRAAMEKEGQRPYIVEFRFERANESVEGIVRYPTGAGSIHDGRLNGRRLTFSTTHVPDFRSTPATIRYQGEVEEQGIRLTSIDELGELTTGVARRADEGASGAERP